MMDLSATLLQADLVSHRPVARKDPGIPSDKRDDERILLIAPVGRDAAAMAAVLEAHGFETYICAGPAECCREITTGAGALLLTEEALELPQASELLETFKTQPPWSELPLIILTSGGESRLARVVDQAADAAGSLTLLERPLGTTTLVRSLQVALSSRRRQYHVRDLLEEHQRIQATLRESEAQFRSLADNIGALAWMANPDGWIFFFNQRWFEYTGITPEEMQGWGWRKAHHPEHVARVVEKWHEHLQHGDPWEDTFPLRGKDGKFRWFLSRAFPLRDSEGKITRWFGTNTDVDELRQTRDALHSAQEKLMEHASQLEKAVEERTGTLRETVHELEAFSYSVAHDLRAPLRAMNSFAQLLKEHYAERLDDLGRDYLERISRSAARLDTLIQDVLNYTRIIRAPAPLRGVDLDQLVRDIIQSYPDFQPPHADIQIEGTLPPVQGHEGFITQCVSNLLSNAVKFVRPGERPRVRIWAHSKRSGDIVRIWFEDNGIGIAPENYGRIFQMFERIHSAAEYEGTGIGLTIVKKAAERMGGRVGFESDPGKGSKFWLELKKK